MRGRLSSSLEARAGSASVVMYWESSGVWGPGERVDLVYAVPSRIVGGLGHWSAELCWYEGETLVVAYEASVFARMALRGHAWGLRLAGSPPSWCAGGCDFSASWGNPTSFVEISGWLDGVRGIFL